VRLGDIRNGLKRGREERRRVLTTGERVFAWSYTVLSSLLIPAGVVLLLTGSGATHGIGIVLLAIGLLAMAVPISPLLRARVRQREAQADRQQ
jgi:Zn-dependent protease with chaperone function